MAKAAAQFFCRECGYESRQWAGQCPACGAWNSITQAPAAAKRSGKARRDGGALAASGEVKSLDQVDRSESARILTGIAEFDRVLGGGFIKGGVTLIGGDPGIGKSTLLLQFVGCLADTGSGALYVSGEESHRQVANRAERLGLPLNALRVLTEVNVDAILATLEAERPEVAIIDSVQTLFCDRLNSAAGSVSQVRECVAEIVRFAKRTETAVFLVGHVTKEGTIAGPRVLEHMVDTVLYFEGDSGSRYRMLRAVKNRFGAVDELGVFAMTDDGLKPVANPSAIFLSRHDPDRPGSAILVTRHGTRPMLVEVQALADSAQGSSARRLAVGLDQNRVAMLLAILSRHAGIDTHGQDIYVNVVGGVKVTETAADLAVIAAVVSSLRNRPLPAKLALFGELGLAGEVRPVPGGPERAQEAAKHGFDRIAAPAENLRSVNIRDTAFKSATRLEQALELVFDS